MSCAHAARSAGISSATIVGYCQKGWTDGGGRKWGWADAAIPQENIDTSPKSSAEPICSCNIPTISGSLYMTDGEINDLLSNFSGLFLTEMRATTLMSDNTLLKG
jgi:hypothetical protein